MNRRISRQPSAARRLATVAFAVSAAVACGAEATPPLPPPPPPPIAPPLVVAAPATSSPIAPVASAPPAAAASSRVFRGVDVSTWEKNWPKGWTDPRVVAALAESCDFAPMGPEPEPGADTEANVFACGLFFEQACIVTPCGSAEIDCKHHCEESCSACTATCTNQCGSCEAACTDAACKKACAARTGACKDGCSRSLDHCATATCTKASQRCSSGGGKPPH